MNMIERVARAICKSHGGDPDMIVAGGEPIRCPNNTYLAPQDDGKLNVFPLWHTYAIDALEAVRAMREPTKEMVDAGYTIFIGPCENVWQAMIDEALKG